MAHGADGRGGGSMLRVVTGIRHQCLLAGILLILMSVSSPAWAEKRVALVIGNSAYTKTAALPNPKNDALAIADLLRKAGFDASISRRISGRMACAAPCGISRSRCGMPTWHLSSMPAMAWS
jgi:hypothetical protein